MSRERELLRRVLEELEFFEIDSAVTREISDYLAVEEGKEEEPVATVAGYYGGKCVITPLNPAVLLPVGMALYTGNGISKTTPSLNDAISSDRPENGH